MDIFPATCETAESMIGQENKGTTQVSSCTQVDFFLIFGSCNPFICEKKIWFLSNISLWIQKSQKET